MPSAESQLSSVILLNLILEHEGSPEENWKSTAYFSARSSGPMGSQNLLLSINNPLLINLKNRFRKTPAFDPRSNWLDCSRVPLQTRLQKDSTVNLRENIF